MDDQLKKQAKELLKNLYLRPRVVICIIGLSTLFNVITTFLIAGLFVGR